jgi:hypothetical protein
MYGDPDDVPTDAYPEPLVVLRCTLYNTAPVESVHTTLTRALPALIVLNPVGAAGMTHDRVETGLDWADAHWALALLALTS